ncbi:exosortase [Rhodopirellula rubra]|uniref:Exosortase n=1 Tax=Aporhodopirellula rubra TaxID=980271 RepID=A0A7W5H4E6_9BACT|nr:exosortase [Aporhodopirellula rubra]
MLAKPHYQFLLLAPFAFWLLWGGADEDSEARIPGRSHPWWGFVLLLAALAGLALATFAWSPWLAMVAALFALLAFFVNSSIPPSNWLPTWIFAWAFLPLPFGLDEDLIIQLRSVTTRLTSGVLDELGILHQTYANVVKLPSKSLFVADACSGIHSLYVLMAFSLFLGLYLRRSVVHCLMLLGSTFGLVLVENVTRIVIVAWALGHSRDLSEGTPHTWLGVFLFLASTILVISVDQLLLFLLPHRPFHFLSKRFSSRGGVTGGMEPSRMSYSATIAWTALSVVFAPMGAVQIWNRPADLPSISSLIPPDFELVELGEEALPPNIGNFQRTGYEVIRRVEGDPFGRSSQRWIYRSGDISVSLSIDYPYENVKDLCLCYVSTGWEISDQRMWKGSEDYVNSVANNGNEDDLLDEHSSPSKPLPLATASISRELFGTGLIVFSSFDLDGKTKALIKDISKANATDIAGNKLTTLTRGVKDVVYEIPKPPYIQIHLFARTHSEMDEATERSVIAVFQQARRRLTPQVLATLNDPAVEISANEEAVQ